MRKIVCGTLVASLAAAGFSGMTSCSKGGDGPSTPDSLKVTLSASSLVSTGFEGVTVTVKDKNGADVTGAVQLFADGVAFTGPVYYPDAVKQVAVTAQKGTVPSNVAVLDVTAAPASPFTQKIVVEDFTGTWCGYCPRVAYNLENYIKQKPACVSVGVHGGSSTEPFTYQYINTLANNFAVNSFPWAVLNNATKWDEKNATLNSALTKRAPLGLAIESATGTDSVTGKIKVKFDVSTNLPLRIVIMLVEDKLVYNQTNYYTDLGANPLPGFVHTNILRKIASADVVNGDAIPAAAAVKGNVWEQKFSFSLAGKTGINTNYTANAANCKIVAFVQYDAANTAGRKGALNVQFADAGATKDFD